MHFVADLCLRYYVSDGIVIVITDGSCGLELIVYLIPSLVGEAVAASFAGFLLGLMYLILTSHARCVLPRWLLK